MQTGYAKAVMVQAITNEQFRAANAKHGIFQQGARYITGNDDPLVRCVRDEARFYPRDTIENDEQYKQIVPYCILVDERDRVLSYRRPDKGGEERLEGMRSIGFGGHVEEKDEHGKLTVIKAALRELREEIGEFELYPNLTTPFGFIYDMMTAVGRVHLGVALFVRVKGDSIDVDRISNDREVAEMQWVPYDDLVSDMRSEKGQEYENWSRIIAFRLDTIIETQKEERKHKKKGGRSNGAV